MSQAQQATYWSPTQVVEVAQLEAYLKEYCHEDVGFAKLAQDQSPHLVGELRIVLVTLLPFNKSMEGWVRENLRSNGGVIELITYFDTRERVCSLIARLEKAPAYVEWTRRQDDEAATRDRSSYGID